MSCILQQMQIHIIIWTLHALVVWTGSNLHHIIPGMFIQLVGRINGQCFTDPDKCPLKKFINLSSLYKFINLHIQHPLDITCLMGTFKPYLRNKFQHAILEVPTPICFKKKMLWNGCFLIFLSLVRSLKAKDIFFFCDISPQIEIWINTFKMLRGHKKLDHSQAH